MGGYQSRSGGFEEERNLLAGTGIEPGFLGRASRCLLTIDNANWVHEKQVEDKYKY